MYTEWQEGRNWLTATWSHCIACEPVVPVWISGIKVGNHARPSARASRFANSRLCCVCITLQYSTSQYFILQAVSWLRWLVTNLSPWWPGYDPRSVHVAFMVEKVVLEQVLFDNDFQVPFSWFIVCCEPDVTLKIVHSEMKLFKQDTSYLLSVMELEYFI
jgi:hypothetical protein